MGIHESTGVLKSSLRTSSQYQLLLIGRHFLHREDFCRPWEAKLENRLLQENDGTQSPDDYLPVATFDIDQASSRDKQRLKNARQPIVLRGLLRDCQAVQNWNLDHLNERCGDAVVGTLNQGISSSDKQIKHYAAHEVEDICLADVIQDVRDGGKRYATATSNIFRVYPELLQEIGLASIKEQFDVDVIRPEIFVGGPQHGSYFHCALGGNFFCQIHGTKQWIFVDPAHTHWMYPNIGFSGSGLYVASPVRTEVYDAQETDYPLFRQIPKYRVVLEPGDVLINPSWWWHEVRNCSESIAVALRIPSLGTLNPLFSFFYFANPMVWKAGGGWVWNRFVRGRTDAMDLDDSYRKRSVLRRSRKSESVR